MIHEIYERKLQFDFYANQQWIELIINNNLEATKEIRRLVCHILNVHHIWNARIESQVPESEEWDDLPSSHWTQLSQENYNRSLELLNTSTFTEDLLHKMDYFLNHSFYHRGQIAVHIKNAGIKPPSFNFVSYE